MSRIGRMPIMIPAGVTVNVAEGNVVTVKGKLGTLTDTFNSELTIKVEGDKVVVERPTMEIEENGEKKTVPTDDKDLRALHGLTRTLINNMVVGVSEGYTKTLEIVGTGYRAAKNGKKLNLFLGHSLLDPKNAVPQAKFVIDEPEGITFELPTNTTIVIKGADKQAVGQIAAVIRGKRPPEPYHGKGVKYSNEYIRRKAGKTGKSSK